MSFSITVPPVRVGEIHLESFGRLLNQSPLADNGLRYLESSSFSPFKASGSLPADFSFRQETHRTGWSGSSFQKTVPLNREEVKHLPGRNG